MYQYQPRQTLEDIYVITPMLIQKRREWKRKRVEIIGEKNLASAVLERWKQDVKRILKVLKRVQNLEVIKSLVYDLQTEINWLGTELASFWAEVADLEIDCLRMWAKVQIRQLLKSRPHLTKTLSTFLE